MDRVAIFVDVGYLCTGGAHSVSGKKCSRSDIRVDIELAFLLIEQKKMLVSNLPLLRVYWYDGSISGRLSTEQVLAAKRNDIKLRLGIVNGQGEQKEVDTKLVTDLAELARNKSIADAILLGGDGDLRLGIELAQQHGVRVHLLTIEGTGVSEPLKMEADTWTQISRQEVSTFLTVSASQNPQTIKSAAKAFETVSKNAAHESEEIVKKYLQQIPENDKTDLINAIKAAAGAIPAEHNGRLLAKSREAIGRDLLPPEKNQLRKTLKSLLGVI